MNHICLHCLKSKVFWIIYFTTFKEQQQEEKKLSFQSTYVFEIGNISSYD